MAKFIELTQAEPGIGPMAVNLDNIVLVSPSAHADGGCDVIVRDGKASYDPEEGYRSYTLTYRVKESYQSLRTALVCAKRGK